MSYTWLAEKKKEAMAKKLQKRGMPSYGQLPIRERYGVSNTGYGPDGMLQKNAPAGMEGRHIYHEGETKADIPEGSMYINARTTKMAFPETEQQQAEMKMYEKSGELPGFQTGGFIQKAKDAVIPAVGEKIKNTMPWGENPQVAAARQMPTQPNITPVVNQMQPVTVKNSIPEASTVEGRQVPQVQNQLQLYENKIQPQVVENNVAPQEVTPDRVAASRVITTPKVVENKVAPASLEKTVLEKTTEVKSAEDAARQQGMQWFMDALQKENPALMLEGRRALSELSSRQQQERSALEQQLLQQGVDPGRARVEAQMLRNNQEGELNDLASKFGIAGMQARQDIAGTLASQGLQGQRFESERQKYKDSADWQAYEQAIAAGDFETAAAAYQRVTGNSIDMTQMKRDQDYLNTKRGQDIVSGDIANDAARFNLDSGKMQAMINDINNGVPLETINSTYGTSLDANAYASIGEKYALGMKSLRAKVSSEEIDAISAAIGKGASLATINAQFPNAKLSLEEYKAMYEATPLGERTWERNMSYAKTLLEAGGEQNIQAAAGIFNQAFPGTGIDFSKLITADKAASFNNGMGQLGTYVAAGMGWDEALIAMKKDGTFDMLGMDDVDVEKIYRTLNMNAIDAQYKQLTDSDWWNGRLKDANGNPIPGPTEEEKNDIIALYNAQFTGELEVVVQKEYTVTKNGETSSMYFNNQAAADEYASKNGATVTATGKQKVTPRTSVLDEDENTVAVPDATGKAQGTVFVENGKTWKVGADDKATELPMPTEIWSNDADAILKSGREGNPYYDDIIEQRYDEMNNVRQADMTLMDSAVAYEKSNQFQTRADARLRAAAAWNTEFTKYKKYSFDDPVVQKLKDDLAEITDLVFIVKDGDSWKFDYKK